MLLGHVALVEESQRRKRHAEAVMYLVPYGRYNLSESPMPVHLMKRLDEDVPPGNTHWFILDCSMTLSSKFVLVCWEKFQQRDGPTDGLTVRRTDRLSE